MDNHKKYLSDEEIINVIKSYIDEKLYNYAVMIDGEWGSGKTYFVKNTLIPDLKEKEQEKKPIRNRNSQSASFLTPLHFYIQSPFRPERPPTMFHLQKP